MSASSLRWAAIIVVLFGLGHVLLNKLTSQPCSAAALSGGSRLTAVTQAELEAQAEVEKHRVRPDVLQQRIAQQRAAGAEEEDAENSEEDETDLKIESSPSSSSSASRTTESSQANPTPTTTKRGSSLPSAGSTPSAPVSFTSDDGLMFKNVGCFQVRPEDFADKTSFVDLDLMTPLLCVGRCSRQGYRIAGISSGNMCWCADALVVNPDDDGGERCGMSCTGNRAMRCGGKGWYSTVFNTTTALREPVTVYVAPAKRTSSLFVTGRFEQFLSGKYIYRKKSFNNILTRTEDAWVREVCVKTPGKKIFVQIAGAVTFLLTHYPPNSVFVLTADETGNWGLDGIGPHGEGEPFQSNQSSSHKHIVLPPYQKPFFKQYYDHRQWDAFGDGVRFVPLGSRSEFPDIASDKIIPADKRTYVYSFMVSLTDSSRIRLARQLENDTVIPSDKRYMHIAKSWQGNANSGDYVAPEKYQEIMLNSVFTLCPRGHSVEQFRIYEAIEAGSIPVLEQDGDYLKKHLSPEYWNAPFLFVDHWDDVVATMNKAVSDPAKLLEQQRTLLAWYDSFMHNKTREIEVVLESKIADADSDYCAKMVPLLKPLEGEI